MAYCAVQALLASYRATHACIHKVMPDATRSPAVARIAEHTGCRWPLRSSKVDDFNVILKPICDFLVINSNLGIISHRLATIARERPYATCYYW